MGKLIDCRRGNAAQRRFFALVKVMSAGLALASSACAASPAKGPSQPLLDGEPKWPEEVVREAEHADRVCRSREAKINAEYQEAKEEQERFKTVMGSITGAVGTAGGVAAGVSSYVIDSPETAKTVTGVTGFVSGGLGAVGSVVTLLVSPGAAKMESSKKALAAIEEKRAVARALLKDKDPSSWSDTEKEAWSKASKELETACK